MNQENAVVTYSMALKNYNLLRVNMGDNDTLIDITNSNHQGWLPSKAWEWFKSNK